MKKNKYLGFAHSCRLLIEYLCVKDVGHYDSRFVDSDGDCFEADIGYLLDGLREFELYFEDKAEKDK